MNADELAHLVEDIISTWPAGVRGRIWTRELAELDATVARGIYEHLADTDEKPPSVARFLGLYRSATPSYDIPRPEDTGPPISLDEHRSRLEWRANTGDHDAIAELDAWRRNREPRVTTAVERHPAARTVELEEEAAP